MPAGSSRLALYTACVLLVVSCIVGQNANTFEDLASNPNEVEAGAFPEEENSIQAHSEDDISWDSENNVAPESPTFNIEDDFDFGLTSNHLSVISRYPFSDMDIENDVDLGLNRENHRRGSIGWTTDEDLNLDLNQHSLKKEPIHDNSDFGLKPENKKEPISDDDSKNDNIESGLRNHERVKKPVSDNDMVDDTDFGLKRGTKRTPASVEQIENDTDFSLKHESIEAPMEHGHEKEHISDEDDKMKHEKYILKQRRNQAREFRLQREQKRKEHISRLKSQKNIKAKSGNPQGNRVNRKQNSIPPAVVPVSQIRRKTLEEMNWNGMATGFDEVLVSQRQHKKQQELDQEEQQMQQKQQTPESRNARLDNICHQYDVDGCSIPFQLPFPFKELFTNSCYRHDICYGCGIKYGFDREACDYAFKHNLWEACVTKYGDGQETITDPEKRLVVKVVESLHEKFDDVLRLEMEPVMTPSFGQEEDLEKFQNHANFVQRKVLRKWVALLREKLYLKKTFASSSKRKSIDLEYDKELLRVQSEAKNSVAYDNNLTTNVCDDILNAVQNDDNLAYHMVELTCEEIELLTCYFFDNLYFLAVRVFGSFAFHETPEFYCGEPFVKKCLPKKY